MSQTKLSVIILPADKLIAKVQHLEVLVAFVSYIEFPKTISPMSITKNHSHIYLCPASSFSYMAWND